MSQRANSGGNFLSGLLREIHSADTPQLLPTAHLTSVLGFASMIKSEKLEARTPCKVFGRKIVYMHYGQLLHRPQPGVVEALKLPIGLLFAPRLLDSARCYYPFDTGAYGKFYGKENDLGGSLESLSEYEVLAGDMATPAKLVRLLFGSNRSYLRKEPARPCPDACQRLATLLRFLREPPFPHGADFRQRGIEVHFDESVPLAEDLLWVGLPREHVSVLLGSLPEVSFSTYEIGMYTGHPSDYIPGLHGLAMEFIRKRHGVEK